MRGKTIRNYPDCPYSFHQFPKSVILGRNRLKLFQIFTCFHTGCSRVLLDYEYHLFEVFLQMNTSFLNSLQSWWGFGYFFNRLSNGLCLCPPLSIHVIMKYESKWNSEHLFYNLSIILFRRIQGSWRNCNYLIFLSQICSQSYRWGVRWNFHK